MKWMPINYLGKSCELTSLRCVHPQYLSIAISVSTKYQYQLSVPNLVIEGILLHPISSRLRYYHVRATRTNLKASINRASPSPVSIHNCYQ
jgi:hypothetical protein